LTSLEEALKEAQNELQL
jgi:hypothetical protein